MHKYQATRKKGRTRNPPYGRTLPLNELVAFALSAAVFVHLALIPEKNIFGKGAHSFLPVATADKITTTLVLVLAILALLMSSQHKSRFALVVLAPALFLTLGFIHSLGDGGSSVVPLFSYLLIAISGSLSGYYLSRCNQERVRRILIAAALAGAGMALYQYFMESTFPYQMTGLRGFNDAAGERVNRALGLTGEPLATATISMVGLLCTAGWKPKPFVLWPTRGVLIGGLAVTFSRGSLFAGLLGACLLIVLSDRYRAKVKAFQLVCVGLAAWITIAAVPVIAIRVLRTNDASYTVRAGVLSEVEAAMTARLFDPIFGSGAGTHVSIRSFFGTPLDNGYLDIFVNWGLLGLIAVAVSAFSPWRVLKSKSQYIYVSLLAVMANGITYEFTHYSSTGFLFFFVLAACHGAYESVREEADNREFTSRHELFTKSTSSKFHSKNGK